MLMTMIIVVSITLTYITIPYEWDVMIVKECKNETINNCYYYKNMNINVEEECILEVIEKYYSRWECEDLIVEKYHLG